jgi:hypothetical protein
LERIVWRAITCHSREAAGGAHEVILQLRKSKTVEVHCNPPNGFYSRSASPRLPALLLVVSTSFRVNPLAYVGWAIFQPDVLYLAFRQELHSVAVNEC